MTLQRGMPLETRDRPATQVLGPRDRAISSRRSAPAGDGIAGTHAPTLVTPLIFVDATAAVSASDGGTAALRVGCERVGVRYDSIGHGYSSTRREEPRFTKLISTALGEASSVVNVGAGAGSYEPRDRQVLAIEPSGVMAAQRPAGRAPVIRGEAHRLPLRDRSADAAMSILSLHHWDPHREEGVRELRRVASGPVVILTCDPEVSGKMWLMKDYLPEVAELDHRSFPSMDRLATWLGGETRIDTVPIPRDTSDWMLMSFWAHPERVLDATARGATSGFARMRSNVVERVVRSVEQDLGSGAWDAKHGQLRRLQEYDAGLRLVVNTRG